VTLAAYESQDVPFERVVEAVQPVRVPGRHPLFQIKFVLQNTPAARLSLPGLTMQPVAAGPGAPKFDLLMTAVETRAGLLLEVEYDQACFAAREAERLAEQFEHVLARAAVSPETPISALAAQLASLDAADARHNREHYDRALRQRLAARRRAPRQTGEAS
jgi:non-ribosomal peptide synthetase component F